ncbi:MAG: hypothetical protein ACTHKN_17855 [Achromobacter mucicolens]
MAIDFTRNRWGHAIHGGSFHPARAEKLAERVKDWWLRRRRYTVLVHSECPIMRGDQIRYRVADGFRMATVARVAWKLDPRDMAELEIVVAHPDHKDGGANA